MPTRDVPGASLHYCLDGPTDAPLIILANSLGTAVAMWDGQIPVLTRGFSVLRFDMRGHGASSLSTEPFDVPALGCDVLSLMDGIGARTAHFLGLSLGGLVGLWLGAHAPERSHKLVLANTAAVIGTQATWDARIASVKEGGMAKIVEGVLERWFSARFRESDPDAVDRLRRILLATSGAGYIAACAAVRDADLRATAAKVRVPTLLITGEFDAATPPSGGRWLAERIAGARHVELEAAHLSNVEAESAFNESVLGFLSAQGETRHGRAAAT